MAGTLGEKWERCAECPHLSPPSRSSLRVQLCAHGRVKSRSAGDERALRASMART